MRDREWWDYYDRFPYCSAATVRDGCHPRIMQHAEPTGKAIVLVHGLSDSPHFMCAIGEYFFRQLSHDVYLPLLQGHGLVEPHGMEGVSLEQWKANVSFALDAAASRAERVSVGGLSTGGTLSFYAAATDARVRGSLYLFAAALALVRGVSGPRRDRKVRSRRADSAGVSAEDGSLIGANPYRYTRVPLNGALELVELIEETDALIAGFRAGKPFSKRVFAAHSESDASADIAGIERLQRVSDGGFTWFRIPAAFEVEHASLVLRDPVFAAGTSGDAEPLEKANPQFQIMMEAIAAGERPGASRAEGEGGGAGVVP